jgi:MoaA/NifB/PqqE/SkfB family radical SAM enzyme
MKLINTAYGILGAKFLRRPFYLRFQITLKCNYGCRMCGIRRSEGLSTELSHLQISEVVRRLARLGARHVVITGGEPFLRQDLPDVIAAFASNGFSVRVQTNGGPQVTRELLAECARAGLRDLSVSIDTLDETVQDSICGTRNVVENALRSLRLAKELLPEGITQANVVASHYNFEELPALVSFFWRLGAYTYITPVMIAHAADGPNGDYRFRGSDGAFSLQDLDPDVRERVVNELISLRRRGMGLTNSTRFLQDWRRHMANEGASWRCQAGQLSLDIRPDGGICFCKEQEPIGNILDESFFSFFRSREFRRQAAEAANACEGCFYGEYREPYYAVRDMAVFGEWLRDWFITFRHGMRFSRRR